MKQYKEMLREIVRDQGEPANFRANAIRLTDTQIATALREYDDVLPEVAGDIAESVVSHLSGNNCNTRLFGSVIEAIGMAVISGCRHRLMPIVKRDLECMASDMEQEDETDDEFAREAV